MGQYYKVVILKGDIIVGWLSGHNFNTGVKLMEHAYMGNLFVEIVEQLISPDGEFYKNQVVWAGDYADDESSEFCKNNLQLGGSDLVANLYSLVEEKRDLKIRSFEKTLEYYRYVVNHTKKLYVDKENSSTEIHPLPLLVSEGNGRGGGDYVRGNNMELCGTWARDSISVENIAPEGYTELVPNFHERDDELTSHFMK